MLFLLWVRKINVSIFYGAVACYKLHIIMGIQATREAEVTALVIVHIWETEYTFYCIKAVSCL